MRLATCLLALFGISMSTAAWAGDRNLSYVVLKENEPIGHETVALHDAAGGLTVDVETETRVKVLFLDFHYRHRRTEQWSGGRLVRMIADTDDDGTPHHIEAASDGQGVRLVVDGASREFPADVLPLSLWGKAILDRTTLYSIVDATPYKVTVKSLGNETVNISGRAIEAQHYRIAGEVDRDLWYGPDGLLLKVAFEHRGYPIQFIRE